MPTTCNPSASIRAVRYSGSSRLPGPPWHHTTAGSPRRPNSATPTTRPSGRATSDSITIADLLTPGASRTEPAWATASRGDHRRDAAGVDKGLGAPPRPVRLGADELGQPCRLRGVRPQRGDLEVEHRPRQLHEVRE